MRNARRLPRRVAVAAVGTLALLGLAACGGATPTAPGQTGGTLEALSPATDAAIQRALDDEFHAEAVYERVIADFGELAPFVNVVRAETRHSTALAGLYERRGLPVPANGWSPTAVPGYASVPEACAAAVAAEIANIALYDELLAGDLPADVRLVFENNRAASLTNHLPAFQACS